ncbi:MAG: MarR family winged helix-turn-helix transcriptional regulator [Pseudomonadota bacterium]
MVAQTKPAFLDCLQLVERLHRRLLDVIKVRLEELGLIDINSVQALLLYNVGSLEVTAGELKSRGYYQGSNVSYNLKKLVEMGYMAHKRSEHDRRSVRISLTEKGIEVCELVDKLYDEHLNAMLDEDVIGIEALQSMRGVLRDIERFWSEQLRYV